MCGIAGMLDLGKSRCDSTSRSICEKLLRSVISRGADGTGTVCGEFSLGSFYFAHSRLAIRDLSESAGQPFESICGRYILIFNGEIFNYKELKTGIERVKPSIKFSTSSDTEILVEYISMVGIDTALNDLVGMFAIALWDNKSETLVLARDRFGEKPMFYGWGDGDQKDIFVFGSSVNTFRGQIRRFNKPDEDAIRLFLRYSFIPEFSNLNRQINKLGPGCMLKLDPRTRVTIEKRWWDPVAVKYRFKKANLRIGEQAHLNELDSQLNSVVSSMLDENDVDAGTLLSGGVDSTLITAIASKCSKRRLQSFVVGFNDKSFDESRASEKIASKLGIDLDILNLDETDILDWIIRVFDIYDEPFADSSQIATAAIFEFARPKVKVLLTGDGGDEIFGGYARHKYLPLLRTVRPYLGRTFRAISPLFNLVADNRSSLFNADLIRRLRRGIQMVKKNHAPIIIDYLTSLECSTFAVDTNFEVEYEKLLNLCGKEFAEFSEFQQTMLLDLLCYLPGDVLTKVDRASMYAQVEARCPFLDVRTVNAAWKFESGNNLFGKQKSVLRTLIKRYVPDYDQSAPKKGFAVPLGEYFKGPLRNWGQDQIACLIAKNNSIINEHKVKDIWLSHQTGVRDMSREIWALIWLSRWLDRTENCSY